MVKKNEEEANSIDVIADTGKDKHTAVAGDSLRSGRDSFNIHLCTVHAQKAGTQVAS